MDLLYIINIIVFNQRFWAKLKSQSVYVSVRRKDFYLAVSSNDSRYWIVSKYQVG